MKGDIDHWKGEIIRGVLSCKGNRRSWAHPCLRVIGVLGQGKMVIKSRMIEEAMFDGKVVLKSKEYT